MAGDSAPIEPRNCMHEYITRDFGPFAATATTGQTPLAASTNMPLGFIFDRETVIDYVTFFTEVISTGATGMGVRLAYATDGQTMAAAVTASQYVTASVNLKTDLVAGTKFVATVDTTNNLIPAGARLFLVSDAGLATSVSGFGFLIRTRTVVH